MRPPTAPAVVLLAALGVLTACGGTDEGTAGPTPSASGVPTPSPTAPITTPGPSGSAAPSAGTALTVVVDPEGTGATATYALTCDPPAGDLPDPAAACAAVAAADASVFEPLPADTLCTQQFGGPEVATVTGTLAGEPLDATFSRTDGCRITQWDAVAALLPTGR